MDVRDKSYNFNHISCIHPEHRLRSSNTEFDFGQLIVQIQGKVTGFHKFLLDRSFLNYQSRISVLMEQ